jgi:hypothetical protein
MSAYTAYETSPAWTLWWRGPARLEDGFVEIEPDRAEPYAVHGEDVADLLWDLAGIRRPTDTLAFIRRYGLLWHGPGDGMYREAFADWKELADLLTRLLAQHIAIGRAREGDREALAKLRNTRWSAPGQQLLHASPSDASLLALATEDLSSSVSMGLRNIRLEVMPANWRSGTGETGQFVFMPAPENLVDLASWQLAEAIVTRVPIAECPECGRVFPVRHGRQRFCDDRCAGRARYRRHAEKKRRASEDDGE